MSEYITDVVVTTDSPEVRIIATQMGVGHKWRDERLCGDAVTLDAVVADADGGWWADPGKLHPPDHHGEHYHVAGILGFPRSPQGHPLLVQAGSSPQGVDLAAEPQQPWHVVPVDRGRLAGDFGGRL
jgi:alkanesulfonate monooxygenase SsuD/methylene tetrahydromethanopterin reductase-like flavin-dependent oxidoreductase (luciferase family)